MCELAGRYAGIVADRCVFDGSKDGHTDGLRMCFLADSTLHYNTQSEVPKRQCVVDHAPIIISSENFGSPCGILAQDMDVGGLIRNVSYV